MTKYFSKTCCWTFCLVRLFFFSQSVCFYPPIKDEEKDFSEDIILVKRMMWVSMTLLDSQELLKGYSQAVTFGTYVSHLFLSSIACVAVS